MGNSPIVSRINGILAEKGIQKKKFYEDCGITSASYSLWNTGKTMPRMKNLEVISAYLGTTTNYLLTGLGSKEKTLPLEEKDERILIKKPDPDASVSKSEGKKEGPDPQAWTEEYFEKLSSDKLIDIISIASKILGEREKT